jgi:hypothetical protein
MNTKKLIGTSMIALLVVAMGAGMVAADPAEIDILPDGVDLVPGQNVTTTAHIYKMLCSGSSRTLDVSVTAGTASEITYYIIDNNVAPAGTATGIGSASYTYTPAAGTTEYDITVMAKAASGTEGNTYTLRYYDSDSGNADEALATVHTTAIPEFATIAIPAIALLGLVLYMRRKKD